MITSDFIFIDPQEGLIWKAAFESKEALIPVPQPPMVEERPLVPHGSPPATCIISVSPLQARWRDSLEAPGFRCCPKNPFHSSNQVFPELGKGRKKEGIEEGRTREEWEARELSKVFMFVYPDL